MVPRSAPSRSRSTHPARPPSIWKASPGRYWCRTFRSSSGIRARFPRPRRSSPAWRRWRTGSSWTRRPRVTRMLRFETWPGWRINLRCRPSGISSGWPSRPGARSSPRCSAPRSGCGSWIRSPKSRYSTPPKERVARCYSWAGSPPPWAGSLKTRTPPMEDAR